MNAPCAPVSSCIIEADLLHGQTTFHDVKTEVLNLRTKSYNAELVL